MNSKKRNKQKEQQVVGDLRSMFYASSRKKVRRAKKGWIYREVEVGGPRGEVFASIMKV
jgi:hypothetical protein